MVIIIIIIIMITASVLTIITMMSQLQFFMLLTTVIEQQKEIEENIRLEKTDFCLQSVYDPAQFHGNVFRLKKDLTDSIIPENDKEVGIDMTENNCTQFQEVSVNNDNDKDTLRIMIPVAGVEGDFRMIPGNENNIGRKCDTEVQVLQYGTYQVRINSVKVCFFVTVSVIKLERQMLHSVRFVYLSIPSFSFFPPSLLPSLSLSLPPSLPPSLLPYSAIIHTNTHTHTHTPSPLGPPCH